MTERTLNKSIDDVLRWFDDICEILDDNHADKANLLDDWIVNGAEHFDELKEFAERLALLPREKRIEDALSWAAQQTYYFAGAALDQYCEPRGLHWESDAMYGYITFSVKE